MPRDPTPTWFYVLVVVRRGSQFLLIHEQKLGQLWFLPAGRVEPGETWLQAAHRETLEEAGIPVIMDGVLAIEHSPLPGRERIRVVFAARPQGDAELKSVPDQESLGAAWMTLEQAAAMPLRDPGLIDLFRYVQDGGRVYPLDIFASDLATLGNQKGQDKSVG